MEDRTKLETALDELLAGKSTEEIVGPNGLLKQLTKALVERAMNAEMSHHLGYEKHAAGERGSGNYRNGKSPKKIQGDFGSVGLRCRVIATALMIQRSSPNMSDSPVSTKRFCRCTLAA